MSDMIDLGREAIAPRLRAMSLNKITSLPARIRPERFWRVCSMLEKMRLHIHTSDEVLLQKLMILHDLEPELFFESPFDGN
jgi:hypothetical protein